MRPDDSTKTSSVTYKPAGPGMYMTFRCAACCKVKEVQGRKMKRVLGLRQYVCKGCV